MDDALTLSMFFESWELFREAALSGLVAGAVLGLMGVYVVLRRMVFLSAALSQMAGLGVAVAFYLKVTFGLSGWMVSPALGAFTMSLAAIAVVMSDRGDASRRDAILGVLFLLGSAATLALGTRIVEEIQDIQTLLFGTAVAVVPEDFKWLTAFCAGLLVLHLWWWRGFVAVSVDRQDARIRGIHVGWVDLALLGSLALGISIVTRILGALPAFAFSVLPAVAALQLATNVQRSMWIAGFVGAACGFGGYVVAFLYSLPVGASQTLLCTAVVALAFGVAAIRNVVARAPADR